MSVLTRRELLAARGPKNPVDPRRPYAFLVEQEHSAAGTLEDVATIFLTNKECPFSCVYCDLWKNTTDRSVQPGDIPAQIDYALSRLPPATTIKLYNSGNFFDPQAILPQDHDAIISRVRHFDRVIVENHPHLVDLWIAIKRSSAGLDWEREFIALAKREGAKLSHAGYLEVIPFTDRRGWVVARGVNHKAIAAADVESLVRKVVGYANARLSQTLAAPSSPPETPDAYRRYS